MQTLSKSQPSSIVFTFLLSCFVVLVLFIWQGHTGFSMADEGYLWYGSQRTLLGDIPIRDFMAYDPGRYYWCAALMKVVGSNGIMAVRAAVAVFQVLGLATGILVIARGSKASVPLCLITAVILALWMFPRHKLFDITLSLWLVGALTYLVASPSTLRYLLLGAIVGLAAVFGRNHGVYGVAGSLLGMAYLAISREDRRSVVQGFLVWCVGVFIGYLPVLLMLLAVPGFSHAFLADILFLIGIKTTNLPLPVPWPWDVSLHDRARIWVFRDLMVGAAFLLLPLCGVLVIAYLALSRFLRREVSPALVASGCFILPYAHYAFSRADIGHLALGIFPLLLSMLALAATVPSAMKWIFAGLLLIASTVIMLPVHPGWQCHETGDCLEVDVAGDRLLLDRSTASDVTLLQRLDHDFASGGKSIVATPFWPGAYPLLERKSPVWEIYALSPYRSVDFQRDEIARIAAASPGFVIVVDAALDGRDELRFHNTHPLTARFFSEHFDRVSGYSDNPDYWIFKSKSAAK
ncbi:hypothetical protein [Paraburkholderia dipogonis]|uniref:hypothetical protein n=1 Tax=Paraburkholderia dipogonis TaxID=1211383 RepID=UPI0038BDF47A